MNKFIVIGSDSAQLKEIENWANEKQYKVDFYSEKEWNEIEKKVVPLRPYTLPYGALPSLGNVSLDEMQIQMISRALEVTNGNISRVSGLLKVGRATLYRKIKEYNIDVNSLRSSKSSKTKTFSKDKLKVA